jgi:hypothetical protein
VRIPPLQSKLKSGTAQGQPHTGKTVSMTGSQVMHFTMQSVALLEPLLSPEMLLHPAWKCWVKHTEMHSLALQHSFTSDDVTRLDDLVLAHAKLFNLVPEYYGLKKPKHHFAQHLAPDVFQYGPPRGYWCFGFESFNQLIKRAACRSNFKNEVVSVMQYWSVKSARALVRGLAMGFGY